MKLESIDRAASALVLLIVGAAAVVGNATAQNAPASNATALQAGTERALLRQMAGTWDVQARMWMGPGTESAALWPLPSAV